MEGGTKYTKKNCIVCETCYLYKYITFILETASSACIIRVVLVGCPSQTSCVDPKYRARNNTPSISTEGSRKPKRFIKHVISPLSKWYCYVKTHH